MARVRRGCILFLVIAASALVTQPASATGTLDQQYDPGFSLGGRTVGAGSPAGQTFTAGITGTLDQVDLYVQAGGPAPDPLTVSITTVDGSGLPTTTVLGSGTIAFTGFGTVSWQSTVGLSATVSAGTQYAIVATTTGTTGTWAWQSAPNAALPPGYSGGQFVFFNGTSWQPSATPADFGFKTYVSGSGPTCTWSRIRQPVNQVEGPDAAGISAWKAGSKGVAPAKFQLTCDGDLVDTQAEADAVGPVTLHLAKLSGADFGDDLAAETLVTGSANTGSDFRFDDATDLYVYNIGLKALTRGTYRIRIEGGGDTQDEFFALT